MQQKHSYFMLLILIISSFVSCSHQKKHIESSTKEDSYWSQIVDETKENKVSILLALKEKNPSLYNQIITDSKDVSLTSFWGKSQNFDSGAKQKIIDDQIIQDLHKQFALKTDNMIVNAGVTHTYGYLFSVLSTPYGFKRKRWIDPTLNYAFSFKEYSLSPDASAGGLLSNLTFFAGTIAFKNLQDREALKKLKNVSSEVRDFDYSKLSLDRVEEEFSNYVLRTTLVLFPRKTSTEENDYLLIYSILNKNLKKEELITAFPIKKDAYEKIITPETLGEGQPISIRYNAYLDGFMNQKILGNKKITKDYLR